MTIFSLSLYCRMHKQSHTLGKTFGIAEFSVNVHHLLAEDVSGHINSPGIIMSLIFSQLTSDGEHLDLTHFAYAHYYLLSVYLLQDVQTVSHSWQSVRQN